MADTKENILLAALHLFAQSGYEAVSVSDIAGELGMGKSALYKHYKNKRDIFDNILLRMEALDAERAREYELPEGTVDEMEEAYKRVSIRRLVSFGLAQFILWTQDAFYCSFRKMLTLEQFRSDEMRALYQQYIVSGPLGYITDIFHSLNMENASHKAIVFYAPMFLLYSVVDASEAGSAATAILRDHFENLCREWGFDA